VTTETSPSGPQRQRRLDCRQLLILVQGTPYCPTCTSVRQTQRHELEQRLRDGTAPLPTREMNMLRRHRRRLGLTSYDDDEIRQFCRAQTDEDLLAIPNFGATTLTLVRAWSGPPEERASREDQLPQ
jgi:hypothetical protein